MRVEVRLFATLIGYLPPGHERGSAMIEVPDDSTVADVCRALRIPEAIPWMALVNGLEASHEQGLAPDDVLTVFPPLAGGLAAV